MSGRPAKPKEYFTKLLAIPEDQIDYTDSPPTTRADWEDAEVLFPMTAEEFRDVKRRILDRRLESTRLITTTDYAKIKRIAVLGEQFPAIYLLDGPATEADPLVGIGHVRNAAKRRSDIEKHWFDALQFFLSKVFYGRLHDNRMLEYFWYAYKVLDCDRLHLLKPNFSPDHLDLQMEREGVKNRHDRHMVIDSLSMARNLDLWDNNIASFTLDRIRNGKITEVYKALIHKGHRGLHGIGPKRASVFIRDVVMIWKLEQHVNTDDDFITCVPIDTHFQQTCERVGLRPERNKAHSGILSEQDVRSLARQITHACNLEEVSPFYFDVGAWMVGMARKRITFALGKPMIRGTPVEEISDKRMTEEEICAKHQPLTLDDIRAARILSNLASLDLLDLLCG